MTIQQLKIFLLVCEELNFTKAADRAYITRQAVKQNISALEDELGGVLFQNAANRLTMTDKAFKLRTECRAAVAEFDRLTEVMYADINSRRTVKLGISTALIPDYLPKLRKLVEEYRLQNPHLKIDQRTYNNDELSAKVISHELDAALVMDMQSFDERTKRYEITKHPSSVLISPTSKFWNRSSLSLDELNGEPFFVPGFGIEFVPIFSYIRTHKLIENYRCVPNFYQVCAGVREQNCIAINRFIPSENPDPDATQNILLEGLPPICSALIVSESCSRQEIIHLAAFLKKNYAKILS